MLSRIEGRGVVRVEQGAVVSRHVGLRTAQAVQVIVWVE